jgi:hypothetical protein
MSHALYAIALVLIDADWLSFTPMYTYHTHMAAERTLPVHASAPPIAVPTGKAVSPSQQQRQQKGPVSPESSPAALPATLNFMFPQPPANPNSSVRASTHCLTPLSNILLQCLWVMW